MSAYIVDNITINRIVNGLQLAQQGNRAYPSPQYGEYSTLLMFADAKTFGNSMLAMNVTAVGQRYPQDTRNTMPGSRACEYCPTRIHPPRPVQLLKSIGCFLYQCSEGDVPETNELYKALRSYEAALALHIVQRSDEYDKADWE